MATYRWGEKLTRFLLVGAACQALWVVSCSSGPPAGPTPTAPRTTPPPVMASASPVIKASGSPMAAPSGSPAAKATGSPGILSSGSPVAVASGMPATAEPTDAATGPVARIKGLPKETQMRREKGYKIYQEKCASCHGANGEGTKEGPALKGKYVAKSPAEAGAAVAKGSDPIHTKFGTADDGVDMASFLNYWK